MRNLTPHQTFDEKLFLNTFSTNDCKSNAFLSVKIANMVIKPNKESNTGNYMIQIDKSQQSIDKKTLENICKAVNDQFSDSILNKSINFRKDSPFIENQLKDAKKLWKSASDLNYFSAVDFEGIPSNCIIEP